MVRTATDGLHLGLGTSEPVRDHCLWANRVNRVEEDFWFIAALQRSKDKTGIRVVTIFPQPHDVEMDAIVTEFCPQRLGRA